jgi:hypothetical protein
MTADEYGSRGRAAEEEQYSESSKGEKLREDKTSSDKHS